MSGSLEYKLFGKCVSYSTLLLNNELGRQKKGTKDLLRRTD